MAKSIMQDIVTKSKKPSLRESLPKRSRPEAPSMMSMRNEKKEMLKKAEEVDKIFPQPTRYPAFTPSSNDGNSRAALWGLAIVSVIFLVFALSSLFSGATVTLTPKSESFALNNSSFTASTEASSGDVLFQMMTLSDSETKTINSSEKATVDKKATGTVVIYNAFNSSAQKLVVNTRLEDPDGKIYRIDKEVTVPGTKVVDGETVPGSVEVTVHADQPGKEYNIDLTDFTIPGFKGGPRYEKFYARSKTVMTGAISGEVYVLDEKVSDTAVAELSASLKEKLITKAKAELPAGFVLFDGAVYFQVSNPSASFESTSAEVPVKVEGKLEAIILDEQSLAAKIASLSVEGLDPSDSVYISKINDLNFALNTDPAALNDAKDITFSLSGSGAVIWSVDDAKLSSDLAGKAKSGLREVLTSYSHIDKAEAKISPFWRSKFPNSAKDIEIINTEASK